MADNDDERKIGDNVRVDVSMNESSRQDVIKEVRERIIGKRVLSVGISANGLLIAVEGSAGMYMQGTVVSFGVADVSDQPPGVEPEPVEEPPYTIQ